MPFKILICGLLTFLLLPTLVSAQDIEPSDGDPILLQALAGGARATLVEKSISFDATASIIPPDIIVEEVLWDFGDGVSTTGEKVSHSYQSPDNYLVKLKITTSAGVIEDSTEVRVFDRAIVLITDASAPDDQIRLGQEKAAKAGVLLHVLKEQAGGSVAFLEETLTQQLLSSHEEITQANLLVTWTSGNLGANVLSRFAQHIKQTDEQSFNDLAIESKGVVILTNTPFGVLSPTAQSMFDQLLPEFVMITRPEALQLIYEATDPQEVKDAIFESPFDHRLLGTFSSRAISDLGVFNFMSFGINYLVNRGVPTNNIILILVIPVIATLLAFARQVIGIKAFGLLTPAMATLAFLVLGLEAGLIVFVVVLLSGTLTRMLLRKLHLLYLPRMALVLTSASLAILVLLGIGVATGRTATLAFSIFPILILIILAEEFIAAQFSRGARTAFATTMWTLFLSILCYYIASWQLLRVALLSYPEIILLAIPINILLGRFTGLRLVEYFRFRELLRYGSSSR